MTDTPDEPARPSILRVGTCYQDAEGHWHIADWTFGGEVYAPFFAGDRHVGYTMQELAEIAAKAGKQ